MCHIVQSFRKVKRNQTICRVGKKKKQRAFGVSICVFSDVWLTMAGISRPSAWTTDASPDIRISSIYFCIWRRPDSSSCIRIHALFFPLLALSCHDSDLRHLRGGKKNRNCITMSWKSSLWVFLNRCRLLHRLCCFDQCKYLKKTKQSQKTCCLDALTKQTGSGLRDSDRLPSVCGYRNTIFILVWKNNTMYRFPDYLLNYY